MEKVEKSENLKNSNNYFLQRIMLSWYLLFQYWIGSNEGIDATNQNAGIDGHPANGLAGFIPPKIIASHRNAHVQNINEKLHEMPMSSQLTGLPGKNSFLSVRKIFK